MGKGKMREGLRKGRKMSRGREKERKMGLRGRK